MRPVFTHRGVGETDAPTQHAFGQHHCGRERDGLRSGTFNGQIIENDRFVQSVIGEVKFNRSGPVDIAVVDDRERHLNPVPVV